MSSCKMVLGYFTTENNLMGLDTTAIERRLGLRPGRLDAGARVWQLTKTPGPREFEARGSTRLPAGAGLDRARTAATQSIPGAWYNRKLVKVEPLIPHSAGETYPPAMGMAAEQWELTVPMPAQLLRTLARGQVYFGGR